MSPKGGRHEALKIALLDRWYRLRPDEVMIAPGTTFRLSEDTYFEPDVVIFPREGGLASLSAENALLVVEIADSSLRYDRGRKAKLYAGFGIRELWVIDAVGNTLRIHLSPAANGYGEVRNLSRSALAAPIFAPDVFALRLDALNLL